MKTLDQLYAIHSKIKNIFLALGGAGVFVMMLYITVDVLVRNLSNTALIGTFEIVSYYAAYDSPFYVLSAGFRCYAAYCGNDQPLAPEGTADRRHYSADFGDCGLCSNVQIFHQVCHLCNQ